jgi:prophage regulatory protein
MKLIDARGLKEKGLDYSDTHRTRLIRAGRFPKPIKLGPHSKLHWSEQEIDDLIAAKLAERDRSEVS